jgi:hypothetical protein
MNVKMGDCLKKRMIDCKIKQTPVKWYRHIHLPSDIFRNIGIFRYWNIGMLECWNIGRNIRSSRCISKEIYGQTNK